MNTIHLDRPDETVRRIVEDASIPDGVICVEHSIFCGKDYGITIHANSATLAPMLPGAMTAPAIPPGN